MASILRRFGREDKGESMVVYAIALGLIALVAITVISAMGRLISAIFEHTNVAAAEASLPEVGAGEVLATDASYNAVGTYPTIQQGLDAAPSKGYVLLGGGTYSELITINKSVTIAPRDTGTGIMIDGGGSGDCVTVASMGVTLKDFTIQDCGNAVHNKSSGGIDVSGLALSNMTIRGNSGAGVLLDNGAIAKTFNMSGGSISNSNFGLEVSNASGAVTFSGAKIFGTRFEQDDDHGLYLESIDSSTIDSITVDRCGDVGDSGGENGAGIEFNLTGGTYAGIVLKNAQITDSGWSTGNADYWDSRDTVVPTASGAGYAGNAVVVQGTDGGTVSDFTSDGLEISGVKANGVLVSESVDKYTITGGYVRGFAPAMGATYDPSNLFPVAFRFINLPSDATLSIGTMDMDSSIDIYATLAGSPDVDGRGAVYRGVVGSSASSGDLADITTHVIDGADANPDSGGPGDLVIQ